MKKLTSLSLLLALLIIGGCGPTRPQKGTGTPNPPFQGQAPEDAYRTASGIGNYGGTLVLGLPGNPKTFNVVTLAEVLSSWVLAGPIYKALVDWDNEKQEDVPGLAKSWDSTPDGLQWTFNLRKGVMWSDGTPFTADDVMFTFQLNFDQNIPAPGRDLFTQSDGSFPTIQKVDEYTVMFQLKEPNAAFAAAIGSTYLVPKHKWEAPYKAGKFREVLTLSTPPEDVVGLGPYRVQSFTTEQRVVLERNPYFWKVDQSGQRLPYIDRVVFVIVPDFNTAAVKFQAGELDMVWGISPDIVDLVKSKEQEGDYTVYDLGPAFNTDFIVLNQDLAKYKNPVRLRWFREQKFRQAVSHAIDRDAIIRTAFQGHGIPLFNFNSPANKLWYTDNITKYPYNPDRARELLKEIGIEDRNGDGKLEDSQGNPIKFTINTNSNRPYRINMGTLIKDNLAKIGMDVSLQPLEPGLVSEKLQTSRDFDAIILGWQSQVPPDPVIGKNALLPSANTYYAFPNQKEPSTDWERRLQELITLNSKQITLADRQQSYWEAMKIWSDYLPEIELTSPNYFVGAKNRFGNFKPSPLANFVFWNIDELYLTK
ncbi:MAG TPA: ABC transporter substrate-binding protein [Blastocatellia bacterium]|nr:ABC transporter substrate-binding protein [Blastocatellia bacterium]